jgi:3-hydroxyisobutyrate dehydrogenase
MSRHAVEVISKGAAGSWQMENRGKTMNAGQVRFRLRRRLDAQGSRRSCLAEARRNGATLPVTALVDQFYGEVQKLGGGRWDTSSLFARLEE